MTVLGGLAIGLRLVATLLALLFAFEVIRPWVDPSARM
jgi:hypothetical protein